MTTSSAIKMSAALPPKDGNTDLVPPSEPSAVSAAERAVEAAQRIAVERIELMRLEFQDALSRLAQRTGLLMAAGLIAILGWCGLAIAAVILLAERIPLPAAIALVAGIHVLGGAGLGTYAVASDRQRKTT